MDYSGFALLLLVGGLALLVVEFFIPSGGLILISSLICLGASLWCAYHAWWDSNRTMWWVFSGTTVFMIPVTVGATIFILPRTRFGRRILLPGPTREEVTPYAAERQRLEAFIGKTGKALSLMNPGGLVLVDGERSHAESQGMMIESGQHIEVVAIRGNRFVVRPAMERTDLPAAEEEIDAPDENSAEEARDTKDYPLDFDMPQS